jgi:hypothetical protein
MANARPSGNRHFHYAFVYGGDPVEASYPPTGVNRTGETIHDCKRGPRLTFVKDSLPPANALRVPTSCDGAMQRLMETPIQTNALLSRVRTSRPLRILGCRNTFVLRRHGPC